MQRTVTRKIGAAEISIITDGATESSADMFPGTERSHIDEVLKSAGGAALETNFNALVIRSGGKLILADAGPRDLFGEACGHLHEGLAELGLRPDDFDMLIATHLHPDHIAGMITPEGAPVFPKATLHISEADRAFWTEATNFAGALSGIADWGKLAESVLEAFSDRLHILPEGGEVAPGLTTIALAGHTPGHVGWRLDSGGQSLIHVGDIVHVPALQITDPEIGISFDIDMDAARETRKALLDQIASDGTLFTGGHMLNPAFNKLERHGKGYRLHPGTS